MANQWHQRCIEWLRIWQTERALRLLAQLKRKVRRMAQEHEDLTSAVTALKDEITATETTLDTIEQKLIAATQSGDMSAVVAATAEIHAMKERLAAARVAAEDNDANT